MDSAFIFCKCFLNIFLHMTKEDIFIIKKLERFSISQGFGIKYNTNDNKW